MTNGWVDIKNTDMMLIMGGNPAENHPCGFKWAIEAKRTRNAKMICRGPALPAYGLAVADLFCQIRAGSDIAFLGGVIHYAIENNRFAKDYLINYTNAALIVKNGFKLPGERTAFSPASMPRPKATTSPPGIMRAQAGVEEIARRIHQTEPLRSLPSCRKTSIRSIAAAPQLRVPADEETLLALYAGNGRASPAFPKINSSRPGTCTPPSAKMAT